MQGKFSEVTSIKSKENKTVLILIGVLFLILVYFIGLNFLDPAGTEVIIEEEKSTNDPALKKEIVVNISGAVEEPGVYTFTEGARVVDVVSKAKGILPTSNENWVTKNLNLSSHVSDEQKIYVPFEWEMVSGGSPVVEKFGSDETAVSSVSGASSSENSTEENTKTMTNGEKSSSGNQNSINVNSASEDVLIGLTGIGEVYAGRIIQNRPYSNLNDLLEKTEIPESTINKISGDISFE